VHRSWRQGDLPVHRSEGTHLCIDLGVKVISLCIDLGGEGTHLLVNLPIHQAQFITELPLYLVNVIQRPIQSHHSVFRCLRDLNMGLLPDLDAVHVFLQIGNL